MNKNIQDYIKVFEKRYDEDFCKNVVEQLKQAEWRRHSFNDPKSGEDFSYPDDLFISYEKIDNFDFMMDESWKIIKEYIEFLDFKWHNYWMGFTPIRFNRYDMGTNMKEHCDHIRTIFEGERKGIPVLSVLTALNDDYKGGEFIMLEDQEYKLNTGDVIVFPSNFLYPHKVNTIVEGSRYSCVSWVW